MVASVYRVNTV